MTELIITEKPQAALKIASALADTAPIKHKKGNAVYYEITHKKKHIFVGCAVGHLFGLTEDNKTKWADYPSFDISWHPKFEFEKGAAFTKQYLTLLKQIAKKVDTIIVATDYDTEGAVIGYTVVKYGLGKDKARRMKFSTLTKDELIKSYEKSNANQDMGMVNAGVARHYLDWFYGINLTKALTTAIKNAKGHFNILSTGRVQGPTLKIVAKREEEIQKFIPEKYWEIFLEGLYKKSELLAHHKTGKFKDKKEVKRILDKTKGKKAIIESIKKSVQNQAPPTPFDLTTLQTEAFRHLRTTPKITAQIAQELYVSGLISYPRTSSQKLPASIGFKKILEMLEKQKEYSSSCKQVLSTKLKPNEGKKSDPAHPAIYPTGEKETLSGKKAQLYDLIVRRFLAVFGEPAKRQTVSIDIDVNKELFHLTGTTTLEPGWHTLYGKYAKFKEEELPEMKTGEEIKVKKIYDEEKETLPPKRYSQASLLKEMEKMNLGTKATRAGIIDTLYDRGYIQNQPIETSELGLKLIKTLEKYSPEIIDENLTKEFEEDMEKISEGKTKKETVMEHAKKSLIKILDNFKKHEGKIGKDLSGASKETQIKATRIGQCPACKEGELFIRRGKFGQFIACNKYPECKTIFSIPQTLTKPTKEVCDACGLPKIQIIKKRRGPQTICLNPRCPDKLKDYPQETLKEMEGIESGKIIKKCPKCENGTLKVRRSVYGSFIACDQYPKCRFTESTESPKKKTKKSRNKT
jgi:DNA topoisomerase I